jgi:hypothetical protein
MLHSNKLGSTVNHPLKLMLRLSTLALVALVSISLVGCDTGTSSTSIDSQDETAAQIERERNQEPKAESTPAPTTAPISPFYGDRHGQAIGH